MPGLLTLAITLPIIGARAVDARPEPRRFEGRADPLPRARRLAASRSRVTLAAVGRVRRVAGRPRPFQFVERDAVDSGVRHRVLRRHRRPQPDAAGADRLPDADRAAVGVGEHREEGQGILDLHAAARGVDDRRLLRARHLPVLRVLGLRPDPDVLPDRHLGLRPAHLRRGQVHPLHHGRQRADAGRDHRPVVDAPDGDRRVQLRSAEALRAADSRRARSTGCSSRSRSRSSSRCRCSRSTPGCPMRTCRRRRPAR